LEILKIQGRTEGGGVESLANAWKDVATTGDEEDRDADRRTRELEEGRTNGTERKRERKGERRSENGLSLNGKDTSKIIPRHLFNSLKVNRRITIGARL
jgi:hypothetical protein